MYFDQALFRAKPEFRWWPASCWQCAMAMMISAVVACGAGPEIHAMLPDESGMAVWSPVSSSFEPELGKGVNATETRTFARCITFPSPVVQMGTFETRLYDEFSISSRAELNQSMGVSAQVAAKGLWGSASTGGAYFKSTDIDESAFYWVVNAKYELTHESIATNSPDFDLSASAKRLLQEHGWSAFKQASRTCVQNLINPWRIY